MYLSGATDDVQIIFLCLLPSISPGKRNALFSSPTAEKAYANVSEHKSQGITDSGLAFRNG